MAGKHINEFKNLALSSFISQAMQPSSLIEVRSPATFRCYVDSIDLVSVLLKLSLQKQSFWLDSGGTLVSLGELADKVATNFPKCLVIKSANSEESEDYFGDFVAIEPESGDYFIGTTFDDAVNAALDKYPGRITHTIRIGHNAAIHLGVLKQ